MPREETAAEVRYRALVRTLLRGGGVTNEGGAAKRGFGSDALKVHGRIFAMLDHRGGFVVKLPRDRVDELIAARVGERFDPGHGRLMKEWLSLRPGYERRWAALAREAKAFVGGSDT